MNTSRTPAFLMGLVLLGFGLTGCNSDSSGSVSINNATSAQQQGIRANGRVDPELTADQGAKLLADIRKDPKRLDTLTPQEKRFLAKSLGKDWKDAGAKGR